MSGTMTIADWAKYKAAVDNFAATVSDQSITWHRLVKRLPRYGEDDGNTYSDISIKALVSYNAFRTWPTDARTDQGILDKQYCHIYLTKTYLSENGWLTNNNNLNFDPGFDRFVINGITWKPSGDTDLAQAGEHPLFVIIILERELTKTGLPTRP